jgi:hypothetical protein
MPSQPEELSPEEVEAFEASALHRRALRIMAAFDALPRNVRDQINEGIPVPAKQRNSKEFVAYLLAHHTRRDL